jgi:hypothetical protein
MSAPNWKWVICVRATYDIDQVSEVPPTEADNGSVSGPEATHAGAICSAPLSPAPCRQIPRA